MLRRFFRLVAAAGLLAFSLVALVACRGDVLAQSDDDDAKYDEVTSSSAQPDDPEPPVTAILTPTPTATAAPTATATPTPTPAPTSTPTPTPEPTATPTPTPTPTPVLVAPVKFLATSKSEIGVMETGRVALDFDGQIVQASAEGAPEGFVVYDDASFEWTPTTAGKWDVDYRVTDNDGVSLDESITLLGRHPFREHALVSMGDSVPSGHGLELIDYLEFDPCWRDEKEAYPRRVFDQLIDLAVFDPGQAEFSLVACSGYDVDDLFEREVTGGFGAESQGVTATQVDWGIWSNPRFITITIGANDTGFVGPGQLFLDDLSLDRDQVVRRLAVIEQDLAIILNRLVDGTDSAIYVTDYYSPTADVPQGVPGCRESCFKSAADEVVDGMNRVIAEVVADVGARHPGRLRLVELHELFQGHGAPNGIGPDDFREDGFGIIGDALNIQVAEIHPYCARGETTTDPWINAIDCVHPNREGAQQMANAVAGAIIADAYANPDDRAGD